MPDFPENHYNAYLDGMEEPYDLDGETDDEGQQHPFISPSFIPDYGCRSEDEHPDIPKGLTQEERDTDHLVEYFAGWIACHWEKYRRFVVLSHHKHQPRWKDWNHVSIAALSPLREILTQILSQLTH